MIFGSNFMNILVNAAVYWTCRDLRKKENVQLILIDKFEADRTGDIKNNLDSNWIKIPKIRKI